MLEGTERRQQIGVEFAFGEFDPRLIRYLGRARLYSTFRFPFTDRYLEFCREVLSVRSWPVSDRLVKAPRRRSLRDSGPPFTTVGFWEARFRAFASPLPRARPYAASSSATSSVPRRTSRALSALALLCEHSATQHDITGNCLACGSIMVARYSAAT